MLLYVVIIVIAVSIWKFLRNRNDTFKRIGIPGPEPTILLGNLLEITKQNYAKHPLVMATGELLKDWTEKYGKVYGYFEGGTPIMVVSDPEILSDIFVKQFNNFHGRKVIVSGDVVTAQPNMFLSSGSQWKRLRNVSNPTFTSLKMKQMYPIVSDCVDELIRILDDKCKLGESFNIQDLFHKLTFDVFAQTAFGYQTSVQTSTENKLLDCYRNLIAPDRKRPLFSKIIVFILFFLPELKDILMFPVRLTARFRNNHPYIRITNQLKKVIEERKKQKDANRGRKDFIQLLLEAESTDDFDVLSTKDNLQNIEKKLTSDEIVSQCFLFILAGYETTSTTLGFTSQLLALHPDIQEKLYEEIEYNTSEGQNITYETTQKMTYMEMVINETLRLYPVGQPSMHRRCMNTCTSNDIYIPNGMTIAIDVLTLHFNEEYWGPATHEFNPDRFLPENIKHRHPMVNVAFGQGPRGCIGQRFAFLEAKLALSKILHRYKIVRCAETEVPIKVTQQPIVRNPLNGVFVKLEKRN